MLIVLFENILVTRPYGGAEVQCPFASEVFYPGEVQRFFKLEISPRGDLPPARLGPVRSCDDAADEVKTRTTGPVAAAPSSSDVHR